MTATQPPLDSIVSAPGRSRWDESEFGVASLHGALFHPLWLRLRRGEGQLLIVAVALAAVRDPAFQHVIASAIVVTLLLASLYLFNDLLDRHHDLADARKDHQFAEFLDRRTRPVFAVLLTAMITVLIAGGVLLGVHACIAIGVAYALNIGYSLWWKGIPGLDVLVAGMWGAAIAAVPGPVHASVLVLIGTMTAICHLFQVRRDHDADAAEGVRTITVAMPRFASIAMVLACIAIGMLVAVLTSPGLGATAILPALLARSKLSNQAAWITAKLWFGVVFLAVLDGLSVAV